MVTLLAFLFLCLWRPLPSSSLIGHDVKQLFISNCHKLLELFIPRVPPKQSQFQETRSLKNFIPLGYGARMSKEAALENLRSGSLSSAFSPWSPTSPPKNCITIPSTCKFCGIDWQCTAKFRTRVKYGEFQGEIWWNLGACEGASSFIWFHLYMCCMLLWIPCVLLISVLFMQIVQIVQRRQEIHVKVIACSPCFAGFPSRPNWLLCYLSLFVKCWSENFTLSYFVLK